MDVFRAAGPGRGTVKVTFFRAVHLTTLAFHRVEHYTFRTLSPDCFGVVSAVGNVMLNVTLRTFDLYFARLTGVVQSLLSCRLCSAVEPDLPEV
jgi:hypothetical protein